MRPKLKISNLTNLQDARSSAAVGFDLISFSLERGNDKKLSASLIWNIVNWLSGPGIVLEMNVASLEELSQVEKMFPWKYITVPGEEWDVMLANYTESIILRFSSDVPVERLREIIAGAKPLGLEVKFEISVSDPGDVDAFQELLDHIFLHFSGMQKAQAYIQSGLPQPFGFSLGEEAEEEPGLLDYQQIDDFLDIYNEVFPESEYQNPH